MIGQPVSRQTTIYLIRHGESQLNREKRVSGQLDTPLSPEGVRLSQVLAEQLRDIRFTGIYTSALSRAINTAQPTAVINGLPIKSLAALNELHFGVLEGRYRDTRDPVAYDLWKARKRDKRTYLIPGGERFIDMAERVTGALTDILADEAGGTILIVGHRNTNRALFGMLMQQPEEQWPNIALKSQSVYCIRTGSRPELTCLPLSDKQVEPANSQLDDRHTATTTPGLI
jgi:broad specificity phosphatase PhoE